MAPDWKTSLWVNTKKRLRVEVIIFIKNDDLKSNLNFNCKSLAWPFRSSVPSRNSQFKYLYLFSNKFAKLYYDFCSYGSTLDKEMMVVPKHFGLLFKKIRPIKALKT